MVDRGGFSNPLLMPFLALYRDMNRLFDDATIGGLGAPVAGARHGGATLMPQIDVSETDREIRIMADLPGAREDDIEVLVNGDQLVIRATRQMEREDDRENYHVSERVFGTFQRTLQLPVAVDPDQVQASFENGVLTITIPKEQAQDRSRRIQVQGKGSQSGQATERSADTRQGSAGHGGERARSGSGRSSR
jgi:HSP20 family protein